MKRVVADLKLLSWQWPVVTEENMNFILMKVCVPATIQTAPCDHKSAVLVQPVQFELYVYKDHIM